MESLRPWGFASRQFTDEPSTVYTSEAQISTNRCKLPVENLQWAVLGEGLNYLWKLLLSYKWQHIFTCKTFPVFRQGVVYAAVLQRGLGTWCRTFSINRALLTGMGAKKACRAVCKMDTIDVCTTYDWCVAYSQITILSSTTTATKCVILSFRSFLCFKNKPSKISIDRHVNLIAIGYRICVKE